MNIPIALTCRKLASIPLEALNMLKRQVGFADSDGRIFGNEQLVALFDCDISGSNVFARCTLADDFGQFASPNRDRLTFQIEITRFLHGGIVAANDISQG